MSCLQLSSLGSNSSQPGAAAWPPLGGLIRAHMHPHSTRGTASSPREQQWWHWASAKTRKESFFVQTSPAVGKMHFLPQTVFILAAGPVWRCNSGRASAWRGEHCQATCSWPRLLCCCSHCEGSTGHVQQARQVGDRQQVKSAGYFLRKKQLKTTRIKQDWKPLAKKQGPVWSSASSNFLSRSEHKR